MGDEPEKNQATTPSQAFLQNTSHRFSMGVSGLLALLSFAVLWQSIGSRDAVIVLHYNVYFGIDILGEWWQAYFISFTGAGIWAVHVFLAFRFFCLGKLALCRMALFSLLFLEGMVLIASIAIGLINY